jgi:hypothetical protein
MVEYLQRLDVAHDCNGCERHDDHETSYQMSAVSSWSKGVLKALEGDAFVVSALKGCDPENSLLRPHTYT